MIHQANDIIAGLFAFEETAADCFRIAATHGPLARLFGGQVLAQALAAAQCTAPQGKLANSCHAYFVRPGNPAKPIDFAVFRESDGRSFSVRRVAATQGNTLILSLSASFHVQEEGPGQQCPMPAVAPPERLEPQDNVIAAAIAHMPPKRHFWLKLEQPIADEPAEHQRMLAYASDLYLMHTGLLPLGVSWADWHLKDASLDHAIWFHQGFRADDWLLCAMDSPFTGGARTLARSTFFTRDGRLVASAAQEDLIRLPADWQRG